MLKYKPNTQEFAEYHKELVSIIKWMELEINKEYKHPAQIEIIKSLKEQGGMLSSAIVFYHLYVYFG